MPAVAYLTRAGFIALSIVPDTNVAQVESLYAGWVDAQLLSYSAQIDARLAKRYATPFDASSPPVAVTNWLQRLVTPRIYFKLGCDPNDAQIDALIKDADQVWAELKEAADAQSGLYDLPLRANSDASGIVKNKCRVRADASPYESTDRQAAGYRNGLG